ncbi:hypothetical protein H8E88_20725 [candidate division KSB1 bacterium]|nr:hypothetical protein [candidate division KSB1 bacterium]MBL7092920.1 hypothetical protein [candidate division KSB1 bacterium]
MLDLDQVLEIYESVGHRNSQLFRWLHEHLYTKLRLSSVPSFFMEDLRLLKTKSAVFITLVDDIADNQQFRDKNLLNALIEIPFRDKPDSIDSDYYRATWEIWSDIKKTMEKYPRYSEFKHVLEFDLKLAMMSQEYSIMVNTDRSVANVVENEIYGPHGTLVMAQGTIDLMCSPGFDIKELGLLREILMIGQKVAQLCNMINTYLREIDEEDISSPIIINALLENPDVEIKELKNNGHDFFEQLEEQFENTVQNHLYDIKDFASNLKTINVVNYAETMNAIWEDYKVRVPFN